MKYLIAFIIFLTLIGAGLYIYYVNSPYSTGIERTPLGKLESMKLTTNAFENNQRIDPKFTCDAQNISPAINFFTIPVEARSLALIVEDPDSPSGNFTHWILFNINPLINGFEENKTPDGSIEGKNDFGDFGYGGPCPNSGIHKYVFKLYALDKKLNLERGTTKQEVLEAIKGHIVEESQITGLYERQ
jgi:Raf kinase inhibitor-like YbhB/YbcL family protein